jgi:hypothetical protein
MTISKILNHMHLMKIMILPIKVLQLKESQTELLHVLFESYDVNSYDETMAD